MLRPGLDTRHVAFFQIRRGTLVQRLRRHRLIATGRVLVDGIKLHLFFNRKVKEFSRQFQLVIHHLLRDAMVLDVKEPGIDTGLVDFPGHFLALFNVVGKAVGQVDQRNFRRRVRGFVDDHA